MEEGREFIDYYGLLEVSPDCSDKALELAYHDLAKRYEALPARRGFYPVLRSLMEGSRNGL